MIKQSITNPNFQSSVELRKVTDRYIKKKQFESEIEILKYEALDEYIRQHVLSERVKFEKKPSNVSLNTINEFVDKVKREFKTNPVYVGCNLEQFQTNSKINSKNYAVISVFLLQLPLYESSQELLDKIEKTLSLP